MDALSASSAKKYVLKHAIIKTCIYTLLTILFGLWILKTRGLSDAIIFATGFVMEYSLSIDNIFIFLMIIRSLKLNHVQANIVVKYGIIVTLVLRLVLITIGSALIAKYSWLMILFGIFLIYTAIKMLENTYHKHVHKGIDILPDKSDNADTGKRSLIKFIRSNKLFRAIFMAISADLACSLDSLPAIFMITNDNFLIFGANIFAVIGLRSLYIIVMDIVELFFYLEYALSFILMVIGIKSIVGAIFVRTIPTSVVLVLIVLSLTIAIVFSIYKKKQEQKQVDIDVA